MPKLRMDTHPYVCMDVYGYVTSIHTYGCDEKKIVLILIRYVETPFILFNDSDCETLEMQQPATKLTDKSNEVIGFNLYGTWTS